MSTGAPAGSSAASGSNRRLQQTQNQVDEVVDIMRVNVDKVLERDQKLSELDDRADALQAGASQFETSAAKLKRKYWWKNCKMWAIGIVVVVIIIIIIIDGDDNSTYPICLLRGHNWLIRKKRTGWRLAFSGASCCGTCPREETVKLRPAVRETSSRRLT
ncbi:vesicle-associated membrane protein 3 [Prionailurus iriomotensis]